MNKLRSLLHNYSPLVALSMAIAGLYTMAICIGTGLCIHV